MLVLVIALPTLESTIKPGDTVINSLTQQFAPGGIFVVNLDGTLALMRKPLALMVYLRQDSC